MASIKNNSILFVLAAWLFLGFAGSANAQSNTKDLQARVKAALDHYSMHNITVNVDADGTVSIEGIVDALYDKLDIYQLASEVNGVTGIKDLVYVDVPIVPDDIINANVARAIKDNSIIVEPDKISVTVTEGVVFLRGTVSYYKEKLMATTVTSWQDGVKGVENEIHVLSTQEARGDENIKNILDEIIENHFPLIVSKVSVKVVNGDVTLNGEVNRLWEKDHLKEEFLQVAGVKSVTENLAIKPIL